MWDIAQWESLWELLYSFSDQIEEFIILIRYMYYMDIMTIFLLAIVIILLIKKED